MIYYVVEPEVAGGFGENTKIDHSSGRMEVERLHYKFDGWLGDQLLESTPCYIASEQLAEAISREGLSGVQFAEVEISVSDQFSEMYPNRKLPRFVWLKVSGSPGDDDFGIASGLRLVVSERALNLLKRMGISHAASIIPF
ncbi:hypothetical protein [Luteibacter sp. 3190]|uniref:hypothetical protein n=1 Tax=Luteibacter sp. 3190 TaxID=2817736 RepID=UPI0028584175|nr:hypothetical protein [Luteibacter sp. 3190]MDR6937889.1 hypothetical protein [Luteibacter sp. 3190]